jgi:hypothetical protein
MDIDNSTLDQAAEVINGRQKENPFKVETMHLDITGGLGQIICDRLHKLIEFISAAISRKDELGLNAIKDDIEKAFIFTEENLNVAEAYFQKKFSAVQSCDVVYSEMVVSFTATPIIMAFRSSLIKVAGHINRDLVLDDPVGQPPRQNHEFLNCFFIQPFAFQENPRRNVAASVVIGHHCNEIEHLGLLNCLKKHTN